MGKTKTIKELVNLLAIALRHKIGSIVNENELYAQKYAKDAEILIEQAKKTALRENWNLYERKKIREELKIRLNIELANKAFLNEKKFEIMDKQIEEVLKRLNLN